MAHGDADTVPHGLVIRRISDVRARPVDWLWRGRIARGKVTTVAGHPGLAKSQVGISFAAIVTQGGTWPVDGGRADPGTVVILSAEDDAGDTIRPRLEAAGADLDRCYILDAVDVLPLLGGRRSFSLETDLPRLARCVAELEDVALVIIDPITAYLGRVNAHNNAEVRSALAPLADLAAKHNVAVVAISHLRKNTEGDAVLQVSGSLAFVAAARAAFLVARDKQPQQGDRRLFLPMKNNLAKDTTGCAFRVEECILECGIETSRVVWEQTPVTITATEALALNAEDVQVPKSEVAADFLRDLLSRGSVAASRVREEVDAAGLSWATVRRAADEIGVQRHETGFGEGGEWAWTLCRPLGAI